MPNNTFIGVSNTAKRVKNMYVGVDGVAKKVKRAYVGVNGLAKPFYGDIYYPVVGEIVVDIIKNELFTAATKFNKGRYKVEIASAALNTGFVQEVVVDTPFNIQAFCPSTYNGVMIGIPENEFVAPSIFGGRGGNDSRITVVDSTGDTASNWVVSRPAGNAIGYGGACVHFLPIDGVFGTDFYFAFHCGNTKGGAYGGGAGGRGARYYNSLGGIYTNSTGGRGEDGDGGPGGPGGTGTINGQAGAGVNGNPGTNGTGIGAGTTTTGGVAFFNGTTWVNPTRITKAAGNARITITYLGPE